MWMLQKVRGAKALYRRYREDHQARGLEKAVERHARASSLPAGNLSDGDEGLNKLRFLRREYMYLDWSSWHSAIRDD